MSPHAFRRMFGDLPAQIGRAIDRLPRWLFHGWAQMAVDASLSMIAVWLAWQLRFDFSVPANYQAAERASAIALLIVRPFSLRLFGAYRSIWRYFNLGDAITLCLGAVPTTVVMLLLRIGWLHAHSIAVLPVTVIVLDYGVFVLAGMGVRGVRRYFFEASLGTATPKRTLMVGTEAGLASALRQISLHPEIQVLGLLASDLSLHGSRINGFTVLDGPANLSAHLAAANIDLVLIADADVDSIADAVATAMEFGVELRLLPMAAHIISGDVRIAATPKPELALKQTVPISAQPHSAVVDAFRDRCVLITGAGGSIGSELARQIARLPVDRVLLLDQDENAMFAIHGELSLSSRTGVVPLVADIRDRHRVESIFAKYRPDAVLHAAAYKHVPVMEENCSEAVLNNVVGTRIVAECAIAFGAERFLMISTDKAVNPSSIMGATKRMAELTVQHLAERQDDHETSTRCACVRFGNVMGSNGSVVPIFLRQIAAGGPVTITHEEMTRYFMTIPSAVQLVLQATTLASNGEIYMLDMGDPVKITSLARRLIEMSGLRPGRDIEIRFVGTRPGEKLHEQLWSDSATVTPTNFPSVLHIAPSPPGAGFEEALEALEHAAMSRDDAQARKMMMKMPINYAELRNAAIA